MRLLRGADKSQGSHPMREADHTLPSDLHSSDSASMTRRLVHSCGPHWSIAMTPTCPAAHYCSPRTAWNSPGNPPMQNNSITNSRSNSRRNQRQLLLKRDSTHSRSERAMRQETFLYFLF